MRFPTLGDKLVATAVIYT